MEKERILAAMRAAARAPKIDVWALRMAGPAMEGAKCLPEDLWGPLGEAVAAHAGDLDRVGQISEEEGLAYHENNSAFEDHEVWQSTVFKGLLREAGGQDVWYVPLDELVCLDAGDDEACDFASISRLTYCGTEQGLRKAVHDLIVALDTAEA